MSKNLLIVESPAKAKTIEKYLGPGYKVLSSFGHIRDLPKKGMSVDIENNFEPTYAVSADKKKRVAELKKAAKQAETVWLASDEDREGEAIAWHLFEALKLDPKKTKRITFNEITKTAVKSALKNPRQIDTDLVDAQQARRVLDRVVGYELSPLLWRKVQAGLSAGRVQSVAVRLVVEREREIEDFTPESHYAVSATFALDDSTELPAKLTDKLGNAEEAEEFLSSCVAAAFQVADVSTKEGKRNPGAPFTTSSLQQTASSVLGMSPKQTMMLAQRLYEAGHITYMRTDSVNLSKQALAQAKEVITSEFSDEYYQFRTYAAKSKNAQEAHEAIRPTNLKKNKAGGDQRQQKLYQLIRSRTLASQMAPARLERKTLTIGNDKTDHTFAAKGEVVTFPGFFAVSMRSKDDVILPEVNAGDALELIHALAEEKVSRGPSRYTEASLIRKLEELGIGRPSTYAPTISTIQDRDYVEKADVEGTDQESVTLEVKDGAVIKTDTTVTVGKDSNKLVPTTIAKIVTDFLRKHIDDVVDYDFTAKLEADFDKISTGDLDWRKLLKDFYSSFHSDVEAAMDVSRQEASQARTLGTDPDSKKPVIARLGRYGPMVQIGEAEDDEKPQFASIPKGYTLENIDLAGALKAFELPRSVGETEDGQEIIANTGRYGPYIKYDKTYVNIGDLDPHEIDQSTARRLITEHKEKVAKQHIKSFDDGKIEVRDGRYGPYVKQGRINATIPKSLDPKKLTKKQALDLIEKKRKKPKKKRRTRKKK